MNDLLEIAQPFLIGPVSLIPLVIAIVQAVKEFEWLRGKQLRILAIALGWPLLAVSLLIERGLLSAGAVLACEVVVMSAWGVFGPSGLYALGKQYFERRKPPTATENVLYTLTNTLEGHGQ